MIQGRGSRGTRRRAGGLDADPRGAIRGRGASDNPSNRFERIIYEEDCEEDHESGRAGREAEGAPGPKTQYLRDPSRSVLAFNQSPDVGFDTSLNPYRGCEHGCIYCYARPSHEYLGFSAGLDFETRILVKEDAPALLRREFGAPGWKARAVALSGVTDPYQPIERRLLLTRRCLEVFAEFRNPIVIVTKNGLVTRDVDLLRELADCDAARVHLSVTSLDPNLARRMEPRASHPAQRLRAIEALARAGVPVGVMVAPVIPGLTDHEIPAILEAAARAGARFAGYITLRLPHGVKTLFEAWLRQHHPDRADKVLNRVRDLRGGRLNDPRFGSRMRGEGPFAEQIRQLFELASRRAGFESTPPPLSAAAFRRPPPPQLGLFA